MARIPLEQSFPSFFPEVHTRLENHDVALDKLDNGVSTYFAGSESPVAAGTGAVSLDVMTSYMTLDGTDAWTLAAPTWAGQRKRIVVIAGTNTPVLALTVTGTRVTAANVFTSGTWVAASAPACLDFFSTDGAAWDPPIMTGTWTVS